MKTLLDLAAQYNTVVRPCAPACRKTSATSASTEGSLRHLDHSSRRGSEADRPAVGHGRVGDMNRYMQFQAAQAMGNIGAAAEATRAALRDRHGPRRGHGHGRRYGPDDRPEHAKRQSAQPQQAPPPPPPQQGQNVQATPAQPGAAPTSSAATMTCWNCNAQIPANTRFCPECGSNQQARACPSCGTSNPSTSKFCNNCGTKLG